MGTNTRLSRQTEGFLLFKKLPTTRLCKLVFMEAEYGNTSSGWKYLDHLKFVFNNIGFGYFISNEINLNTFKRFFWVFYPQNRKITKPNNLKFWKQ